MNYNVNLEIMIVALCQKCTKFRIDESLNSNKGLYILNLQKYIWNINAIVLLISLEIKWKI